MNRTERTGVVVSATSLPAIGGVFGCVLAVLGVFGAASGHGSYLTLSLAAAPLSWVPVVAIVAAPALWAGLGVLVRDGNRRTAGLILGGHTVASVGTMVFGNPAEPGVEQWAAFGRALRIAPVLVLPGALLYILGLCMAWSLVLRKRS